MKLFCLVACTLAACAVTDDRPETFAYINETILAPSCGTTLCHSAMKKAGGYAFDSLANTAASFALSNAPPRIAYERLIVTCDRVMNPQPSPCDQAIQESFLMTVMTTGSSPNGIDPNRPNRMPLDQPLASKDLVFIADWIRNGADGYTP